MRTISTMSMMSKVRTITSNGHRDGDEDGDEDENKGSDEDEDEEKIDFFGCGNRCCCDTN